MANDLVACSECRAFYVANREFLMSACATVGIEHNRGTGEMLRMYLEGYHENGHVEPEPTEARE